MPRPNRCIYSDLVFHLLNFSLPPFFISRLCISSHSQFFFPPQTAELFHQTCRCNITVAISPLTAPAEILSLILPLANEVAWASSLVSVCRSESSAAVCKNRRVSVRCVAAGRPLMAHCYSCSEEKSQMLIAVHRRMQEFCFRKWDVCSFTSAAWIFCCSYIRLWAANARRWIFCDCSVINRRRRGWRDSSSLKCHS